MLERGGNAACSPERPAFPETANRVPSVKILLLGATGFIGARLRDALLARGDELVCPARRPGPAHPRCRWVETDLAAEVLPWDEWLAGVDAAVNAVGIFREQPGASFDALHTRMPVALFQACVRAGVRRVLQVSALGANALAAEPFLRSKHAADEQLLALPLDATVVMPSLVFGSEGGSSRQMLMLASMPVLLLPAGGLQRVQPVHVDDLVAALCALLDAPAAGPNAGGTASRARLALVGPEPTSLKEYLLALRRGMGMGAPLCIRVPAGLVKLGARLGEHLPGALLNQDAWSMLQRGSTARADRLAALLQRSPRPPTLFIEPHAAPGLRLRSAMAWLMPVLRVALALVWIATAVVSLGVYPVDESRALLARAGVPSDLQLPALYGAAVLDLAFGVASLWPQGRRAWRHWLWSAQALLVLGYTVVITLRLPEYWLHPYGPMTKNLPLLAVLLLLWTLDRPEPAPPRGRAAPAA